MRTQPIGLDYLMPVWVARVAAAMAGGVLALIAILAVKELAAASGKWSDLYPALAVCAICVAVISRARTVIPRIRDDSFRARIRKFKSLKKRSWDEVMDQMVDDHAVEFVDEYEARMANPLTWGRKQKIVSLREKDLLVEVLEANGTVGSIRLQLIVE